MKRIIAGLAIAAVLGWGTACKQQGPAVASADAQQAAVEQKAKRNTVAKGSHECGAPTKAGGQCKRRVSNGDGTDSAVEARCWMHRVK
jgi:hypothetical protein